MLYYFAFISVVTFVIYGYDKHQSKQGGQRISERTLHLVSLCGGSLAALFSQHFFRHKTKKVPFQITYWAIVGIQCLGIYFLMVKK